MGGPDTRWRSMFYRAINLYLGIGLLLAFPLFMSYLIATPLLIVRLVSGHASLGHLISVTVFFPAYGLLTAIWRMLSWPYGILALLNGHYPSIWVWLAPGFHLQHTIPVR